VSDVLVSLSSFGASEVRRHGQQRFAALAVEAGADGVEVRGELLNDADSELPAMRGLAAVYSSPEGLWTEDATFDSGALDRGLDAAHMLDAARLKMSIGGWLPGGDVTPLVRQLEGSPIELLIENDQTERAGTVPALAAFCAAMRAAGRPVALTFDMGNWHWTGEDPLQAAAHLRGEVGYVHCKGVQRQPHQWIAVPLTASVAPWRALLRALPADCPRAIEYPLQGDDLLAVTRRQVEALR
jgi:sugar phosphate isomerase/epimerase